MCCACCCQIAERVEYEREERARTCRAKCMSARTHKESVREQKAAQKDTADLEMFEAYLGWMSEQKGAKGGTAYGVRKAFEEQQGKTRQDARDSPQGGWVGGPSEEAAQRGTGGEVGNAANAAAGGNRAADAARFEGGGKMAMSTAAVVGRSSHGGRSEGGAAAAGTGWGADGHLSSRFTLGSARGTRPARLRVEG